METKSSESNVLLYVLVLAVVLSPILPCQAASGHLGGGGRKLMAPSPPIRMCPQCVCCAPAAPGYCCPCRCPGGP
ncbi:hypothetical protein EUTSA_v10021873mg [Eutrema salsugineum]|uniref:Uncharacterized protein n=1 Tax=Eutrema salsugineum TaxID=72664 RepID=V4NMP4_EUTSA|nr:uncharacterized protein LOC18023534 [Eutrema salsugineum]ESQ47731.1 hypothetical protein EUTSA_v10021873mg [Eutrema salsugineum]